MPSSTCRLSYFFIFDLAQLENHLGNINFAFIFLEVLCLSNLPYLKV